MMMKNVMMVVCMLALVGCGSEVGPNMPGADSGPATDGNIDTDAGPDDDAGDAGSTYEDLGVLDDLGIIDLGVEADASVTSDLGVQMDLGRDLGTDAGPPDLGLPDLGTDAGPPDLGAPDLGTDAGPPDLGLELGHCIDLDGDGYGEGCALGADCDNSNGSVNPGATEICNNIDDNCDGMIDNISATSCAFLYGPPPGRPSSGTLSCRDVGTPDVVLKCCAPGSCLLGICCGAPL